MSARIQRSPLAAGPLCSNFRSNSEACSNCRERVSNRRDRCYARTQLAWSAAGWRCGRECRGPRNSERDGRKARLGEGLLPNRAEGFERHSLILLPQRFIDLDVCIGEFASERRIFGREPRYDLAQVTRALDPIRQDSDLVRLVDRGNEVDISESGVMGLPSWPVAAESSSIQRRRSPGAPRWLSLIQTGNSGDNGLIQT
jgi:hypothetical protein